MPKLQDTLRRLAEHFVARDIMTPLSNLETGCDLEEAQCKLDKNPQYDVIPIRQGDRLVAFLERNSSKPRIIQIQHVVSAETSILDLVDSLSNNAFVFVLGRHQVVGLVHFSDLNDPIVKLPYFVLLEGLERRIAESLRPLVKEETLPLLKIDPKRVEFLLKKKARLEKENAFRDWVTLLYFAEILQASAHFATLQISGHQIEDLSTVRNRVSHAATEELIESQADVRRLNAVRRLCVDLLLGRDTA